MTENLMRYESASAECSLPPLKPLSVKPAERLYDYTGPLKKVVHRYNTEWVPADKIVSMTPKSTSGRWTTYRFVESEEPSTAAATKTETATEKV
jgi:hypothetical protein